MTKKTCSKCSGTKWYPYDENHRKMCEQCCKHSKWWLLPEGYPHTGALCCEDGCGKIIDSKTKKVLETGSRLVYGVEPGPEYYAKG